MNNTALVYTPWPTHAKWSLGQTVSIKIRERSLAVVKAVKPTFANKNACLSYELQVLVGGKWLLVGWFLESHLEDPDQLASRILVE